MKNSRHYLKFLLIIFLFTVINCKQDSATFSINKFADWYINPTDSVARTYTYIQKSTIDSFFSILHRESKSGTFCDTLHDSTGVPYLLGYSTPKKISTDTLYPLIIYLHGGTGTENNNKGEKAYEMLKPLGDSMELFLASPSANRYCRWWDAAGLDRILQTVRYMSMKYPIDPRKIFLSGVSDGATGCWAAANCINYPFAGFFAVSGFGGMLPQLGITFTENIKARPIYNVNAGKDRLYPIDIVNQFLDQVNSFGVNVFRKSYPDEEHGFDYRDKEYSTFCNYIRTWKLPDSNPIQWTFIPGVHNTPPHVVGWTISEVADHRYVNGTFKDDTLFITSEGIASITVCLPTDQNFIFVKSGNKTSKVHSNENGYLLLKALISQSVLMHHKNHFFKITF